MILEVVTGDHRVQEPIPIRPWPKERVFYWPDLEAAVQHAFSHPLLPAARRDAAILCGANLVDAVWTFRQWTLQFDTGQQLRVRTDGPQVRWALEQGSAEPVADGLRRIGSPAVRFWMSDWQQVRDVDESALVAKRIGAAFRDLFVNDGGVFVYFCEHLVLCFTAVQRETDGQSVLYVYEDD